MNRSLTACAAAFLLVTLYAASAEPARPNLVFILCDDLGYGDVKCLNPQGKIATPNMDRLAAGGMIFTDAHSSSAVCSPTRYGVLTGRYNWRSRLKSSVLGGLSPRLIEPGRATVASFLKERGYATGCIGKWHLGMDWAKLPGRDVAELSIETPAQVHSVDYSKPIANGPTTVGFESYFGISASLDMVPYTFIENDRVAAIPTEEKKFPLMVDRADNGTRLGPAAPGFEVEDVLPMLTKKAVEFIDGHAPAAKSGKPFFLYLPLNAPHTPIAPTPEWRGKSGLNPYADFVMETDATVGAVLDALEKGGLAENTLIIMTSDNGCSPQAKFDELLAKGHNPSYEFRGTKADIFDGGHHVPFLARWPARVKAGTRSDQIVCLTDFFATCAEILGEKLPDTAGEDSVSILAALDGRAEKPLREAIVHHSINGSFAIRQGNWKLELCPDSGGWSAPKPGTKQAEGLPPVQLYDLGDDIGETRNVQADHPEIVARLTKLLEKYVADGRSTPGAPQQNTTPVNIHPVVAAKGKAARK
jgi:arylsulfatase A-like enzyme